MTRRNGVTLIEVLVAIFVMGIGLIALLTLFPIGILRMAAAIQDARNAEAAYNADKVCIIQNVRDDVSVREQSPNDAYNGGNPNFDLFRNPCPVGPPALPDADPYGESYPIFVDPVGFGNSNLDWVGGSGFPGVLRRRPVSFGTSKPTILSNFTLWDDMNFESTLVGASPPATPQKVGVTLMRDSRFSWGYVMRRPQTNDRSVVHCTVVVYDKRSMALSGTLAPPELVYQNVAYFNPIDNTITVDYVGSTTPVIPPVRPGNWIMDATFYITVPGATFATSKGSTSAFFYRVVGVEQLVSVSLGRTVVRYEVQSPLRGPGMAPVSKYTLAPDPLGAANIPRGTIIVMEGISEVFEKGTARLP